MSRLRRFPEHRWVGTRDDMTVYDCDDSDHFEAVSTRVELEELVGRLMVGTFGPDTVAEARNRGFKEFEPPR